jgi:hypothetical protein
MRLVAIIPRVVGQQVAVGVAGIAGPRPVRSNVIQVASDLPAINALNVDLFFPVAVGTAALLIASGVSALRSGALPRWLAWAAIVVGLVAVTPLGFFAFLAGLLWIAVTSIVLLRAAPPAGTPPAPPARR